MTLLEICCYSLQCAEEAQRYGADRIELCAAPQEGGLTPSLGVLKTVRDCITIPVHPIIRPHGGDFCYTAGEFAAMLSDVAMVRDLGFPGVVLGILDSDGQVDIPRMRKIITVAGPLAVTFHRAFDMCADPRQTSHLLADMGVARILTSGQQASAEKGLALITELIAASNTPTIMAGGGIRAANLAMFLQAGVKEVHSSAGQWLPSAMRFRRSGLSMSGQTDTDEYSRYAVNGAAVAEMKHIISAYAQNS